MVDTPTGMNEKGDQTLRTIVAECAEFQVGTGLVAPQRAHLVTASTRQSHDIERTAGASGLVRTIVSFSHTTNQRRPMSTTNLPAVRIPVVLR